MLITDDKLLARVGEVVIKIDVEIGSGVLVEGIAPEDICHTQ